MKTIIIRKPTFMRNDELMKTWMNIAETSAKEACRPELTTDERYHFMRKTGECLNNAAKAGGFFSVSDFCEWLTRMYNNK